MVTEEYKGLYAPIRERSELLNDIAHETALAPLLSGFSAWRAVRVMPIADCQQRHCWMVEDKIESKRYGV